MSPYRTSAEPAASPSGWVGRFTTHVYGDLVIRYFEHRWLWVLKLKAHWFMLTGNGFEQVSFRQLDGSDYRAEDRALAAKYDRIVLLEDFKAELDRR